MAIIIELLNDNLLKLVIKLSWEGGKRKMVLCGSMEEVKGCETVKSSTESQKL